MAMRLQRYFTDGMCVVFAAAMLGMVSCRQSVVDHKQMEVYVEKPKNGLTKVNDDKKVKVLVRFRPSDLLVEQQLQAMSAVTPKTIDSLRYIYAKNLYFVLHMSYQEQEVLTGFASDAQKFTEMVEKLSFNMDSYVSLTTEKGDTLQMIDFVYSRMYGMSGGTDIMFAFENKMNPGANELNFNLAEFGLNTGKMKFAFNVKDITSVPRLNFKFEPRQNHQTKKIINDTIKQQTKK